MNDKLVTSIQTAMNKVIVLHKDLRKVVAFFSGLDVVELSELLHSIFNFNENILGFESEVRKTSCHGV